jgi:hypothetical protein
VTAPLDGVIVAFQTEVVVCPEGSVKVSFQPLIVVLLLLVTVMFEVSPVFQALITSVTWQPPGGGGVLIEGDADGLGDGEGEVDGLLDGLVLGEVVVPVPRALMTAV